MTKCVNCRNDALFAYNVTSSTKLHYCAEHLPKFLRGRGMGTLLREIIKPEEEKPAPKKRSTKKKVEEPVEEPTVEEPVEESTEEPVEETDGAD